MKGMVITTLLFFTIGCLAQTAKISFEPTSPMPKEINGRNCTILDYDNGELLLYYFTVGTDFSSPKVHIFRFDANSNMIAQNVVKVKDRLRDMHLANGKLTIVEQYYSTIISTILDVKTLKIQVQKVLLDKAIYPVYVRWSPNSKYMALLSSHDPHNYLFGDKNTSYRLNRLLLYDEQMNLINEASVDYQDYREFKLNDRVNKFEHYNPDMIVTDNGSIVYASFIYADYPSMMARMERDPECNPEFGDGTKLIVNILTKDGLVTYDFGKVDQERLIDLPTILSYDGHQLLISGVGMTLIECNMETHTLVVKCDNKNWGHNGKGTTRTLRTKIHDSLSHKTNAGQYGYIIWGDSILRDPGFNNGPKVASRTFDDFYWINADGTGYIEGSIRSEEENHSKQIFRIDYSGSKRIYSFYYNGCLYWITKDYHQKGWKNKGWTQKYLLKYYDRQGTIHTQELDADLDNTSFYRLSDNKILIWQSLGEKKNRQQRLGYLTVD